ncbi:MAG TPA: hypothetical protein VF285_11325 [Castellaniella sp.]|uniref:hypothetical protein n=1 Tax=Castellaniella sp. TaxID=1955812 RepID=UPI002F14D62D
MSTQHTPGPWLARAIGTFNEPGYAVFWEDRSKSGVHTRRLDYKGCFTEADAHLIAAAPDLYEALKLALKALNAIGQEMTVGERYTNAGQYLIDALPPCTTALAKAEGKS